MQKGRNSQKPMTRKGATHAQRSNTPGKQKKLVLFQQCEAV